MYFAQQRVHAGAVARPIPAYMFQNETTRLVQSTSWVTSARLVGSLPG